MKICLVTPDIVGPIRNGGIGTFCHNLCMSQTGHEWTVLFTARPERKARHWLPEYTEKGIGFVCLEDVPHDGGDLEVRPSPYRWMERSWRVFEWLRQERFDLIHFQDWGANGFYSMRARRTGVAFEDTPMAVTLHSPSDWSLQGMRRWPEKALEHYSIGQAERYCAENADWCLSPSRHMLEWVGEHGWKLTAPTEVLPCPHAPVTKSSHGGPPPHKEESRCVGPPPHNTVKHETKPLPKIDYNHLVFFGRLETRKGLELFFEGLKRYCAGRGGSVHGIREVSFIGRQGDVSTGRAKGLIQAQKKFFRGIEFRVYDSLDTVEAVQLIRELQPVVFMPSLIDNFPLTVVECVENGFCFFAAGTGGIPEIAHPDALFEPNPQSLAACIERRRQVPFPLEHRYSGAEAIEKWSMFHKRVASRIPMSVFPQARGEPTISVCMSHFNHSSYLKRSLDAIRANDYPRMEVIVLDDGSSIPEERDRFREIAADPAYSGFRFLFEEKNRGRSEGRNFAVSHATGDWLVFADADNAMMSDCLAVYARAAQVGGADAYSTHYAAFKGDDVPEDTSAAEYVYRPLGDFRMLGLLENVFGDTGFCIRRDVFLKQGGFNPNRDALLEDWEFLLTLVQNGYRLEVVPRELYWYRYDASASWRNNLPIHHIRLVRKWLDGQDATTRELVMSLLLPMYKEHRRMSKVWNRLGKGLRKLLGA